MFCPICELEIELGTRKYFFALERPYLNVYLHRDCYDKVYPTLLEYLSDNKNLNRFIEFYNKKKVK